MIEERKFIPQDIAPVLNNAVEMLKKRYGDELVSVVFYGSWARGEQKERSDLDLLVVLEGPFNFVAKRREVYHLLSQVQAGVEISPLVMERKEMEKLQPIHFELSADGFILYDRAGFMSKILEKVGRIIRTIGSERYRTEDGCYGWILKKDLRPGEIIEVEL